MDWFVQPTNFDGLKHRLTFYNEDEDLKRIILPFCKFSIGFEETKVIIVPERVDMPIIINNTEFKLNKFSNYIVIKDNKILPRTMNV